MLRYLGTGRRYYGRNPMRIYPRNCWEFQSIVDGVAAPTFSDGTPPLRGRCMWVLPPNLAHGWDGDTDEACEVIVFHLADVPEELRRACSEDGHLCCELDDRTIELLRHLADIAAENLKHPTALSSLHAEQLRVELSLLALSQRPQQRLPRTEASARSVVEAAIAWFNEHLAEGPRLEHISRAIYVSPAHLRRLFHRVLGQSPRQALDQIRFTRAMQLMQHNELTLESVAEACGFGSASAFSRAFKHWHGCSPRDWQLTRRQPPHRQA